MLAHAAGDFLDGFVDGSVHIAAFGVGLNGDVIGAEEDKFGDVTVFLHVENGLGPDDTGIIEVEALDFFGDVAAQGISHFLMTDSDGDWQINVGSLHGVGCFG